MKRIGLLVIMAVVLAVGFMTSVAMAIEEKEEIYLYERYVFPDSSDLRGLISLSYIVPKREMNEKGPFGVIYDIIKKVVEEEYIKDRGKGVEEYMISVIADGYFPLELTLTREELEEILTKKPKREIPV